MKKANKKNRYAQRGWAYRGIAKPHRPTAGSGLYYEATLRHMFTKPWGETDPLSGATERPQSQWEVTL